MDITKVQKTIRKIALECLHRELLEAHQNSLPEGALETIAEAMVQAFFAGFAAAKATDNK